MSRRLFTSRGAEIAAQTAIMNRLEANFAKSYRRTLLQTYNDCAAAITTVGISAIESAVKTNDGRLTEILRGNYTSTATIFAERLTNSVKSIYPQFRKAEEFGFSFDSLLNDFVLKWTATRVTEISNTTETQIRNSVRRGLENGKTLDEIAKEIRSNSPYMSATRAHIIARTETHTAANAGIQFETDVSEFETEEEWLSVGDDRTRETPPNEFDHVEANGQIIKSTEVFIVSGEELEFPGDPAGSPANIIQCRCCMGIRVV